jgi:hypothetical protein
MPMMKCKKCGDEFYAKPSHVLRGRGKFCSHWCARSARFTGKKVTCNLCGTFAYKQKRFLERSKSGKFFCSKSCQTIWRNQFFSGDRHKNWKGGRFTYRRALLKDSTEKVCTLCRIDDLRVLAAHHIDMNRDNNSVKNLAWLCHNCHYLVHHDNVELRRFQKILSGDMHMVAMV